jgi:hypothetical protein
VFVGEAAQRLEPWSGLGRQEELQVRPELFVVLVVVPFERRILEVAVHSRDLTLRPREVRWPPNRPIRASHFYSNAKAASTPWAAELLARKPYNVVAVALANKMARIAWAVMTSGRKFHAAAV